ncbi:MAG TPA: hypothetical protein VGR45_10565 [Stellaceae bacterium]|nr:hypothetical protein [Stellaceae bacterium]
MATDRLTLTRAFESAGIKSEAAEQIATEIYDAIHDNVATKTDLQAVEAKLTQDIQAMGAKLTQDIQAVKADLELVKHQLLTRLGALVVVVSTLLFAALRYWPPHG